MLQALPDILNVKSPCSYIGGNKNWSLSGAELMQDMISFTLRFVAVNGSSAKGPTHTAGKLIAQPLC